MGTIKQIVYRLEDYRQEKGYYTTDGYDGNFYNINLIPSGQTVTHLGIQAPAGTFFYINGSDNRIMMGRSGVYELEGIEITTLMFEQPIDYQLDAEATAAAAIEAQELIAAADEWRAARMLEMLKENYIITKGDGTYSVNSIFADEFLVYYNSLMYGGLWFNDTMTVISQEECYTTQIQKANLVYTKAVNGVYKKNGTKELENVIIDFMIGGEN